MRERRKQRICLIYARPSGSKRMNRLTSSFLLEVVKTTPSSSFLAPRPPSADPVHSFASKLDFVQLSHSYLILPYERTKNRTKIIRFLSSNHRKQHRNKNVQKSICGCKRKKDRYNRKWRKFMCPFCVIHSGNVWST